MAYCSECGFYLERGDCEMCESYTLRIEAQHAAARERAEQTATEGRRPVQTWWRAVAITPALLALSYVLAAHTGTFPWLAYWTSLFIYSVAVMFDLRYVQSHTSGWQPRKSVWIGLLAANALTAGFLTFFLTPYYLYKRRTITLGPDTANQSRRS